MQIFCITVLRLLSEVILASTDNVVHHAGIGKGRGVAEVLEIIGRHLGQDAPQDFTGAILRQGRSPLDDVRAGDGADAGRGVLSADA